jgi:hypothetical protein
VQLLAQRIRSLLEADELESVLFAKLALMFLTVQNSFYDDMPTHINSDNAPIGSVDLSHTAFLSGVLPLHKVGISQLLITIIVKCFTKSTKGIVGSYLIMDPNSMYSVFLSADIY